MRHYLLPAHTQLEVYLMDFAVVNENNFWHEYNANQGGETRDGFQKSQKKSLSIEAMFL
jgi:hypothetical protein